MLNLPLLFKTQEELDDHIVLKHKLYHRDLIHERLLALIVELGELTNEWRGFKFWSTNQKPRTHIECSTCKDSGIVNALTQTLDTTSPRTITVVCPSCHGVKSNKNPYLEEYVDCLHFVLSVGNYLGHTDIPIKSDIVEDTGTKSILALNHDIASLSFSLTIDHLTENELYNSYVSVFNRFISLGVKVFGFNISSIEKAYFDKNKVNYQRQVDDY